jgi:serine protease Do
MRWLLFGLLATSALGAQQTLVRARAPEGYLGIAFTCPLKRIEDANGVRVIHLAYPAVESVEPGSPAATAGISAGDTILAYDSLDVVNREMSLTQLLRPGRRVLIRLRRNGAIKEVALRVAARPPSYVESRTFINPRFIAPMIPFPSLDNLTAAGAALVRANEDLRVALGAPRGPGGVLVLDVIQGTPAEVSGLHAGDIVLSADGQTISDPEALAFTITEQTPRPVTLRVYGNHKVRTVTLRLP